MEKTPRGLRKHVAIFGQTNSGKSSLFNALTGQDNAIVSSQAGTTTDPVLKNMELLPYGPITLVDTAGLDDKTYLGQRRMEKTKDVARRVDLGIYVYDGSRVAWGEEIEEPFFKGEKILVFTKRDLLTEKDIQRIEEEYPESLCVFTSSSEDVDRLRGQIIIVLQRMDKGREDTLIGDLMPPGSTVALVIPIDSEAPRGRIILPQVQLIRDCLDHGIKAYVTRELELESALRDIPTMDLVVTDSQVFDYVDKIVPPNIPLTSFSMLLARKKGDFKQLTEGARKIPQLKDGDRILVLEGCTHNHSHEDIGRVKIPKLLCAYTQKEFEFDYYTGYDMPEDFENYAMVIQCGSCMLNKAEVRSRQKLFKTQRIPVTNYGVLLAYLNGILDRCQKIFTGGAEDKNPAS